MALSGRRCPLFGDTHRIGATPAARLVMGRPESEVPAASLPASELAFGQKWGASGNRP